MYLAQKKYNYTYYRNIYTIVDSKAAQHRTVWLHKTGQYDSTTPDSMASQSAVIAFILFIHKYIKKVKA